MSRTAIGFEGYGPLLYRRSVPFLFFFPSFFSPIPFSFLPLHPLVFSSYELSAPARRRRCLFSTWVAKRCPRDRQGCNRARDPSSLLPFPLSRTFHLGTTRLGSLPAHPSPFSSSLPFSFANRPTRFMSLEFDKFFMQLRSHYARRRRAVMSAEVRVGQCVLTRERPNVR